MSERYIKLYSLPERLYAETSPLMIAAGNLLKDNQSGNVLAQLKLKNLGERPIKAAKVRLFPLDTAKKPLGDSLVYEYLDLNAGRDAEFGQKTPFPLPNASTRAILAEVIEVVFADYSVWTECGALWEPLPPAEPLENALGDRELAKQYRLRFGEQAVKGPARHRDLWLCSCGALNRAEEELCHACRRSRDEQLDCDLAALTAAKDARLALEKAAAEKAAAEAAERAAQLAKEKAEKAEKAKAKRKKAGKILKITLPLALLIAAAILLGIPGLSAMQAKKAADAGDYIGAVEKYRSAAGWGLFNNLFHPDEKAAALEPAARYQEGEEALAEGRYEDALAAFEAAGDYEDAAERRIGCLTGVIESYVAAGELEKAEELLEDLPQGQERAQSMILLAQGYLNAGDYGKARDLLPTRLLHDTPENKETVQSLRYQTAVGLYETEDYDGAEAIFRSSSSLDYLESNRYLQLCRIGRIGQYISEGNYSAALELIKAIDISPLSIEEQNAFSGSLYDWAKTIENGGKTAEDYASAFALYQLSGTGDYQERMEACNSKYIKMPKPLPLNIIDYEYHSMGWEMGKTGEPGRLEEILWNYQKGILTFELHYTANQVLYWEFMRSDSQYSYSYRNGTLQKGVSTLTITIPRSDLTGYTGLEFNVASDSTRRYAGDAIAIFLKNFHFDQDLYGNPIP